MSNTLHINTDESAISITRGQSLVVPIQSIFAWPGVNYGGAIAVNSAAYEAIYNSAYGPVNVAAGTELYPILSSYLPSEITFLSTDLVTTPGSPVYYTLGGFGGINPDAVLYGPANALNHDNSFSLTIVVASNCPAGIYSLKMRLIVYDANLISFVSGITRTVALSINVPNIYTPVPAPHTATYTPQSSPTSPTYDDDEDC